MLWRKKQAASSLKDGWVEVGKKGSKSTLSVQMKWLPSNPQSVLFRIIDMKTGRTVVEPWIMHQDLIKMLYDGLFNLLSQDRPVIRK